MAYCSHHITSHASDNQRTYAFTSGLDTSVLSPVVSKLLLYLWHAHPQRKCLSSLTAMYIVALANSIHPSANHCQKDSVKLRLFQSEGL